MKIILFYSGLGKPGGITPDLEILESGLVSRGDVPVVTSKLRTIVSAPTGSRTIVNVYGCLPSPATFVAMLIARLRRQTLVWTPVFHPARRLMWQTGRQRIMRIFDNVAPYFAKITHAVSAATDEEAKFFTTKGARRVETIPLAVPNIPAPIAEDERWNIRSRAGLRSGPIVLIVAAHSPRRKGFDFATEVLTEVGRHMPDVIILVVGGGELGPLEVCPGVVPLGWCSDEMLEWAYAVSDILFVPSRYEQFSRVTIEAWAHGLAVVLSDGVALARFAVRKGAGRIVEFGDPETAAQVIVSTLKDEDWRRRAGVIGRELATSTFSPKNYLDSTLALYRSIA